MLPKSTTPRMVVLKGDRLYGDLICRQIKELWPNAVVQVFQRGLDALDAIQAAMPDLFITGVKIDDMDGLEHLEPFIDRPLPILIVTSRMDARTLALLRGVRFDGIYDGWVEGWGNLPTALAKVLVHQPYVSSSFVPHLQEKKSLTLDALTPKEQMVLSVIGDGSDDQEAGDKLCLTVRTVNTYRKTIMAKLGLHHKGQLMVYALQQGYVHVNHRGIQYPGFERQIREITGAAKTRAANVGA